MYGMNGMKNPPIAGHALFSDYSLLLFIIMYRYLNRILYATVGKMGNT